MVDRRERQRAAPPRTRPLRHRAPVAERDPTRAVPVLPADGVRLVQPLEPVGRRRAERSTSQVLGRVLDELPPYDPQDEPLQEWVDDVVDRFARAA